MRSTLTALLAASLIHGAATPALAQHVALDTAALEAALRAEMQATRTPGVSIAIVQGDRIIYEQGFGVANVETGEPVTPTTLFRIGSATKMFTGLAAVLMAREGKVDLTVPIGRYAEGIREPLASVTLHQLLTHTGGLTNEGASSGPHDDDALGERVRQWGAEHAFAPPGDVYSYSGPSYWLAGYAMEQAEGEWYADLVAKRVLEPLGMVHSTFRPTMAMTWPLALDHRIDGERQVLLRPYPDDASTWPSGSLFSSAHELARFAIAIMNDGMLEGKRVLPSDVVRTVHERQSGLPDSPCGYTYGFSSCVRGAARTLGHYGFRVGSGAVVTVVPEARVAVIILANRNGGIFGATEGHVLEQLVPAARRAAPSSGATSGQRPSRASYAGTFANGPDTLRFYERGDTLWYRYGTTESPTRLTPDGAIQILGAAGQPVQQFMLVRGTWTGDTYLHDGLNGFRRVSSGGTGRGRER
ncbi:MAG TPA: serine hydrolase domain-containing protein [Gemmatimonadaceae bacterium]